MPAVATAAAAGPTSAALSPSPRPVAPMAVAAAAGRASRGAEEGGNTGAAPASETREYRREDLQPLAVEAGLAAASGFRPPYALAVIDGSDGSLGAQLLVALAAAFPKAVLWPVGLNEAAHQAMLNALRADESLVIPENAFEQVSAILAPSDVLVAGGLGGRMAAELADALARTPARIILLPPRDERLRWVAAPKWPVERWVENAVIEVGNVLGADEE